MVAGGSSSLSDPDTFASETVAPNAQGAARDEKGRFELGNSAAVTAGLSAAKAQLPQLFEAIETEVQALLDGSLADDGGADDIPTRAYTVSSGRGRRPPAASSATAAMLYTHIAVCRGR